ncbi:MAG: CdaR family protein [Bacilli bacterium]
MKKFLSKIGKGLINFFDKFIITPISRVVYLVNDKFGKKPKGVDRFLNKPSTLLYISLALAFLTFFAIDRKIITLVEKEALVITNQKIDLKYNDEAYVIEGLPKKTDIVLLGRKSDLTLAEQLGDHKVSLDLSDLSVGTHRVKLKYNNPISTLDYKIDPSEVTIVIYPKISEVRTITTDIINTDKLKSTLVVSSVKLNKEEVIIKSYKEKLSKVASVKAIVDVYSTNADAAGTYTLDNVKLVAYDEKGTELTNIEVLPNTISASVTITSPSKTVPIKVVPKGEIKSGSAIGMITSNETNVTVYGDEDVLANLNSIEVSIDVNGLSGDKTFQVDLVKPVGARSMSVSSVTIKVTMEKETQKEFADIPIELENVPNGFKAMGISEADIKVPVIVKGVSSILDKLDKKTLKAYVDLSDIKSEGTWDIPVTVTGTDLRLTYASKTKSIKIVVTKK